MILAVNHGPPSVTSSSCSSNGGDGAPSVAIIGALSIQLLSISDFELEELMTFINMTFQITLFLTSFFCNIFMYQGKM